MTANSQLLTTTPKTTTKKQTKQTTRIGTEPPKWRSHGGLLTGEWEGQRGGKGTKNKQHKWQVENRQGQGKNSIGNIEAKELICMTHGYELQGGHVGGSGCAGGSGMKGGKWDNCNSIINKIYFL